MDVDFTDNNCEFNIKPAKDLGRGYYMLTNKTTQTATPMEAYSLITFLTQRITRLNQGEY